MIDATDITDYNRTKEDLEELILFCVCAAGKNGVTAAKCLAVFFNIVNEMLPSGNAHNKPFEEIRRWCDLHQSNQLFECLKTAGIGCYNHKAKAFLQLAYSNIDLKICKPEELEVIHNIGPKTSRFFILHSRSNVRYAVLDRHILAWMRDHGYSVPSSTPSGKKYKQIEQDFLTLAGDCNLAELDLMIWNRYRSKSA